MCHRGSHCDNVEGLAAESQHASLLDPPRVQSEYYCPLDFVLTGPFSPMAHVMINHEVRPVSENCIADWQLQNH